MVGAWVCGASKQRGHLSGRHKGMETWFYTAHKEKLQDECLDPGTRTRNTASNLKVCRRKKIQEKQVLYYQTRNKSKKHGVFICPTYRVISSHLSSQAPKKFNQKSPLREVMFCETLTSHLCYLSTHRKKFPLKSICLTFNCSKVQYFCNHLKWFSLKVRVFEVEDHRWLRWCRLCSSCVAGRAASCSSLSEPSCTCGYRQHQDTPLAGHSLPSTPASPGKAPARE